MSEATMYDRGLVDGWSKDTDGIFIFAGLFSAIVTAFILESYGGLKPDPNATTVALLQQISQQLAGNAVQNPTLTLESFSPTSSAVRVNTCWFLSLSLALTSALAAALVQQWVHYYTQAIQRRPAPHLQARIRRYLFNGIEKYKISALVEGIPALLHVAVFLFFAGLLDFIYAIDPTIAWSTLPIIAACGSLYIMMTILPVLDRQSPFRTPFSEAFWVFCRFFGLLRFRTPSGWLRLPRRMADARELLAGRLHISHTKLASAGLCWALKNLNEDAELLPFVEGIPAFCKEYEDAEVMQEILLDHNVDLLPRIVALLRTCANSRSLRAASRQVRSITCLEAIAKLCELHSTHPWTFMHNHEERLRLLVIPMTKESDQQVAGAAKIVAAVVVKHIHSLTLRDPLHPISSSGLNYRDRCELLYQQHYGFHLPEKHKLIKEWDALAYDELFPLGDSTTPLEVHDDAIPNPTESANPVHSGDDIPSDQQESQPNNTSALGIVAAVAEGRDDEQPTPSTQATGPSQMVHNQTILANAPVGDERHGSEDEDHTASAEALGTSHTVDPDDDMDLQKQKAETNATAAPVTASPVEEGGADADRAGSAGATGLPQSLDSGKYVHFQQQQPEASIPMTPATAPKLEDRSSDEGFTGSAQAIAGSEAVDSGDNIHPQQPGPLTQSLIRSATAPPVKEGSNDGDGGGEGKGKGKAKGESESEG
ncbi:hypothetical protein FIBSPDRAFT_1050087 [Athelia psychrophila]|uniref:DUF6535 domain-containing protein n=1 Tax=Athelia psychrophila TaxID=1759441 RepID=A0A166B7U9_9AGAM|nr:hypothetical protein FIBSPDRAFT_1050087 [Fibularhizoctonia sp. CBS 109695]